MVFLHFENLERASVSLLMLYVQVPNRGLTLLEDRQMLSAKQGNYPRVTSFDALKQSTDICTHLVTFSSRKYIILDKLSCFQSKHTFREVREHLFCLKYRCQRLNECTCAAIIYFDRHQFRRLSLAVEENDFFTVVQCSQGVLCIVQERPKIISSS